MSNFLDNNGLQFFWNKTREFLVKNLSRRSDTVKSINYDGVKFSYIINNEDHTESDIITLTDLKQDLKLNNVKNAYINVSADYIVDETNNVKYELHTATDNKLGGIKIGFTDDNSKVKVNIDNNSNAYVNLTNNAITKALNYTPVPDYRTIADINLKSNITKEALITALGLEQAFKFVGETSTELYDGSTAKPIVIDGKSYNQKIGDVVIYNKIEFVWDNKKWIELGDGSLYVLKTTKVEGNGYLSGGGELKTNLKLDIKDDVKTKIEHGESVYNSIGNYGKVDELNVNGVIASINNRKASVTVKGNNISNASDVKLLGGPLVDAVNFDLWPDNWKKDGIAYIPNNASIQEIFNNLFTKELYPAAISNYDWSCSVDAPTVTASLQSNYYPVGTYIILSAAASSNTVVTQSAYVNGLTWGYSLDKTTKVSDTSYILACNPTKSGVESILCNWTGFKEVDNTDGSTGATKQFWITDGINNYNVNENGKYCTSEDILTTNVYSVSNMGNINVNAISLNKTDFNIKYPYTKNIRPTNTALYTCNGYYPIYYNKLTNTKITSDYWTSSTIKTGLEPKDVLTSINITAGTGTFYIAIPANHAYYNKSEMVLEDKGGNKFGKCIKTNAIDVWMKNNCGISQQYKVFFISNDDVWPNDTNFTITFK